MKALLLRHRHLTALVLLAFVLLIVWFFESETGHGWRVDFWRWANEVHDILEEAPPLLYFTATGILPLLGIPMVSFYLLTASIYPPHLAILGTVYAIILNLLISFAIGRLGHRWISALIARTGHNIPQIPPRHRIWMTAAVRVAPGAPLLVQNYLLVLAGVPLSIFVLVSLPLEMLIAAGYVLLGRSLFTGNWKMLLVAFAVVACAVLVFRLLRKRSEKRSEALGIEDPVAAVTATEEGTAAVGAGVEGTAAINAADARSADKNAGDKNVGDNNAAGEGIAKGESAAGEGSRPLSDDSCDGKK